MTVRQERDAHGIVVLTLDDPDHRNAMTATMVAELAATIEPLVGDPDLRAVVLTGVPPAFSAGGDLAAHDTLAQHARDGGFVSRRELRAAADRLLAVRRLPVPTIAAINGHAIGAGLCVALACDLRVVASDAQVGMNAARIGLYPGNGASWLLPHLLGPQVGAAWLLTGRLVPGRTAAAAGLAVAAYPAHEVLERALGLATEIATASPMVVRQLTTELRREPDPALAQALDREVAAQVEGYGSADLAEGLAATRERRAPRYGPPAAGERRSG